MAKIIVGIHGLANKPLGPTLYDWWKMSISEGLTANCKIKNPDFRFEMVHWADLLYKYPVHRDNKFNFDKLYNHEPYKPAAKGVLKASKEGWLDSARKVSLNLLGKATDSLREHVNLDMLSNFFLERILKDLAFYYDPKRKIWGRDEEFRVAREVLQNELINTLVANKQHTIMLIAHSMGSIIAYDVLRDLGRKNRGVKISHFITIGSPLGLPLVKSKINEERTYDRKVRTPSIVTKKWTNFADRKDPVAFDAHLRDDYGENKLTIRVKDDLVLNDYKAKGEHNHHKSYGYLRTPEVSKAIQAFLGL